VQLAISEAGQLVCFHVYGSAKLDALEALFRDYDQQLAAELRIDIFGRADSGDSYEIANVLSREWWDDSAWTVTR